GTRTIPAEPQAPACGDGGSGGQRSSAAREAREQRTGPPEMLCRRLDLAHDREPAIGDAYPEVHQRARMWPQTRLHLDHGCRDPEVGEQLRDPPRGTVDRTHDESSRTARHLG